MKRIFSRATLASGWALAIALWLAPSLAPAAPIQTYLAVGDSMAFGETDFAHNPSYGDRGYVKPYADYLGTLDHDRRPNVVNLGVDGETSSTLANGGTRNVDPALLNGQSATQWNLNYPDSTTTQNALLLSTIASEKAAGHNIADVSVQLGANDLLQTLASPGFGALTPTQQQLKFQQTLGAFQANYAALLGEIHAQAPNANLLLLGYHNPFGVAPNSPLNQLADPAIKALNAVIAADAKAFGARYVDTYSPFVGHEAAYTYILNNGNVHPNAAGYSAIAGQMQAQAVPEPGTLAVLGLGMAGLVYVRRRRA